MEQSANSFGVRLRELRKKQNLSLKQLSHSSGVHFTQLSRYERGMTQPTAEMIRRLADALGVEVASLIDENAVVRFRDPEIRQLVEELEKLPEDDKGVIKRLIHAFLFQHRVRSLSA